ncbi:YaeQ family protein [Reinekea forsetii]|nr:YaeQ family protein [Reinekea forsetii]
MFKVSINLSDLDRNHYDTINLTIAKHPSETEERLMARIVAYCFEAQENLVLTKGISDTDEPDMWVKSLDDQIQLWIDMGEPSTDRIKKANRQSKQTIVYSFNSKSDVWWSQSADKFKQIGGRYYQFDFSEIEPLAAHLERTMKWFVTISDETAAIQTDTGEFSIHRTLLHS